MKYNDTRGSCGATSSIRIAGADGGRSRLAQMPRKPDNTDASPAAMPSVGFVSTFPPTACGIATFARSLLRSIAADRHTGVGLEVVSLVDSRVPETPPEVMYQHIIGDRGSLVTAAGKLNELDVVVLQHEFGIYGGHDGEEVLDLVASLRVPTVAVLHTVPSSPTPSQQRILETLTRESDRSVVLSRSALDQLLSRYDVDPHKMQVVPHGAAVNSTSRTSTHQTPNLLTWGLIGPGKGIETAIEAVAELKSRGVSVRYLVQGRTHPKVLERLGDSYRQALTDLVESLDLEGVVEFDDRYADPATLSTIVGDADVVVLPYDSMEQVTSGVLVEAIAAGKPVVATAFPHAVEMLSDGGGVVVPNRDPLAMANALDRLLMRPREMAAMSEASRSLGASLDWARVAASYNAIFEDIVSTSAPGVPVTGDLVSSGLSRAS